jgi:glycosyltransferase involved in cell wall biosynthesis
MRIAYLSSATIPSPSANSLQVMKMCQAFVQEGHEVHLILPPADDGAADAQAAPQPAVLARQYGLTVGFPTRRVKLLPLLGRRGLAWAEADEAARVVPNLVYTRGIDIAWAVAQHGFPVLLEVHQPPAGRIGPLYFRQILGRHNLKLAVISPALEAHLRATYPALRRSEILVAPDAVDGEAYRRLPGPEGARTRLHLPARTFTAGYFGSLAPGRGVELICELAARRPEIGFLVSGGEPEDVAEWKARTAAGNIRWLGYIPNAEIPLHQAACDVLLMPYQREVTLHGKGNTAETMSPLKMYEYMAAGRVILSSDLPALRTMLNEKNSVLLPPADTAAWAEALDHIRRSAERRKRLAEKARADVRPHTWRNRARLILEFAAARHG